MDKPESHCPVGSYDHQVPMPLKGRRQDVDLCLADLVAALNAANIGTAASCCGHGQMPGNIMLDDGRVLTIESNADWRERIAQERESDEAGQVSGG